MRIPIKIDVFLWGDHIGQLFWDAEKNISVFQFTSVYFTKPYNLIPTQRVKSLGAMYGNPENKYQGLPPFIADSLPDSWGNILFDQWASNQGISPSKVNPLLKLAFIGNRAVGALEFRPVLEETEDKTYDIASLVDIANRLYKERYEAVINENEKIQAQDLVNLGSPPGGAHPKALIAISSTTGEVRSGQIPLSDDFSYYIIKFKEETPFPSSEMEMVYYEMAQMAQIKMMPCRLYTIGNKSHFITERFDRVNGEKVHTQTMAALMPSGKDYNDLFILSRRLDLDVVQMNELFRRMCFNIVAGNTDDHNKNFSFMMDQNGKWSLSPAYDIMFTANTWSRSDADVHEMSMSGKRCFFTEKDLLQMGRTFGIKNPNKELETVYKAVSEFEALCNKYNIDTIWSSKVSDVLSNIYPDRLKHCQRHSKRLKM